ncbi:MAG: hypothetical protein CVT63_03010 [Candidatus Anoxymicrobium japonicum]|uniref:Glycerol-3-phosphate dehydrogenase n=1 Tax=Candidatus Anoxymicrobium japonicum TaxID=2013648 RepID=A0A2N3G719_9ACTN|nr:MAG: hypothetical protein CVT63_03010 [Candidatus Anoxymicrobium japonicum]
MHRERGKPDQKKKGDVLAVIGAGAWGTTLAALEASNFKRVNLYTPEREAVEEIRRFHTNARYLDDFVIPENVIALESLELALKGVSMIVIVVPSHVSREVARKVIALCDEDARFVLATKGLEKETGLLSLEVWREELTAFDPMWRSRHDDPLVLSGPNLAREICAGKPAVSNIAGEDVDKVQHAIRALGHPLLTLLPYHDPIGAQVAGALKNVYAVGCGMADGLAWGANAMATIIWRGLEETALFVRAAGGDTGVISTPAGVGDFIATCVSPLSRNHDFGRIVVGACASEEKVRGVKEGAQTAGEALSRGRSMGVEMPLLEAIRSVMSGDSDPVAVLDAARGVSLKNAGAPLITGKTPACQTHKSSESKHEVGL